MENACTHMKEHAHTILFNTAVEIVIPPCSFLHVELCLEHIGNYGTTRGTKTFVGR